MKFMRGSHKFIVLILGLPAIITVFFISALECHAEESQDAQGSQHDHLLINEVYPNPGNTGEDNFEWIEIYNPGETELNLSLYSIVKITSSGREYVLNEGSLSSSVCSSYDFVHYLCKVGENWLSNTGTTLSLKIYPDQKEIDRMTYGTLPEQSIVPLAGQSISRIPDGVDTDKPSDFQISIPTPGRINEKVEPAIDPGEVESLDKPESIASTRKKENGEEVTIQGIVSVAPGILSSQFFYIQDESGGIQIYSYYKLFPEIRVGDVLIVKGELSESGGERRLKTNNLDDITSNNKTEPLQPKIVEIKDIDEHVEGQYVRVKGKVAETSGDTFYVEDQSRNQIKIVIKSMTNIKKPKMRKGDEVEIAGVVSQYKDEYRILPTKQDDVRIINSSGSALPETGLPLLTCPILAFLLQLLWNILRKMKKRLTRLQENFFFSLLLGTYLP